jgi:hypothetical protein
MTKRREFSKPVKVEIMQRCRVATGWVCEECGAIVTSGEIDHTIAEGLVVDKTKKLTAEDGKFLCWPCHQGPEGKTPKDKAAIAQAKRREAHHVGATAPSTRPIQSRGFSPAPKPPKAGVARIDKGALVQIRWNPLTGERLP